MDISPKTLREVEFREKFRGYHPEDVDTFLERVAVGIEALQVQLRQATERAAHAEQLAAETGTTDEALSRTLLLAQRTADTAIEEAREQAARIVATAESQSRIIVEEASQRAQRVAEESQAALRADLAHLESLREQLRSDAEALQQWVEEHREGLSATLTTLLRQLEKGVKVKSPAPPLSEVEIPPQPVVPTPEAPTAEVVARAGDADGEATDGRGQPARSEVVGLAEDEPVEGRVGAGPDEPVELEGGAGPDEPVEMEQAEPASDAGETAEGGGEIEHDQEDDPFMAELRRAVTDTEPLGPREDAAAGSEDASATPLHDDLDTSRRFGPRMRRRR